MKLPDRADSGPAIDDSVASGEPTIPRRHPGNMSLFRDLRSERWLYLKGALFVLLAVIAAGMLWARAPRWDIVMLLVICVWASCRAYYFAFYVIEHYADPEFRFSGLMDFAKYAWRRRGAGTPIGSTKRGSNHE